MPSRIYTPSHVEDDGELPNYQTAIKQASGGTLTVVSNSPIPALRPGMALIRVAAVGLNPTDYKMPSNFPKMRATAGCDFSGTVVKVGEEVGMSSEDSDSDKGAGVHHVIRPGDRVCGAVHGSNHADKDQGCFAQYVLAPASMLARIPESVSWEQGAALGGVGHGTVAQALWSCFNLPYTPATPAESSISFPVLVYGSSTATGTIAMQMLRLSVNTSAPAPCSFVPHCPALCSKWVFLHMHSFFDLS